LAQDQKISVSGLNVRIVDRENRDYEALFRSLLRQKNAAKVYREDHLILTSFGKSGTDKLPFMGAIGRFTDIPEDADWFDTDSLSEADDDQKSEIIIPESLKPNYEAFYCGLFPKEHIFVFETFSESKSLSPRHVLKWLREATKSERTLKRFGPVEVDIIPDYGVLERILRSETLRKIEIVIRKPNPDDYTAAQFEAAAERLERLRAKEERIEYKSSDDEFLDLDADTKALAKVGGENGRVRGRIREDGAMKTVATDEQPLQEQEMFDPDLASPTVMFRKLASRVLRRVRLNRK
jgi:hypothetical protein